MSRPKTDLELIEALRSEILGLSQVALKQAEELREAVIKLAQLQVQVCKIEERVSALDSKVASCQTNGSN